MTILREITNKKHREIESLPLIQTIMSGKITRSQYVCYLYELAYIYQTLETLAKKLGMLSDLPGIERTDKLYMDLRELDSDYHRAFTTSTIKYIKYLNDLANDSLNSRLLFAHIYVRHMGDLYGGKLMARVVPGRGNAYHFEDRPKIIKTFNEKLSLDLGDEANKAFDYFIDIFNELYLLEEFQINNGDTDLNKNIYVG